MIYVVFSRMNGRQYRAFSRWQSIPVLETTQLLYETPRSSTMSEWDLMYTQIVALFEEEGDDVDK